MDYKFPELPYAYDALEPHFDRMTMEIHHNKHHKAYFDKFTSGIRDTAMNGSSLEEIFGTISKQPALIRNNGGGYYNHNLFWEILTPKGEGKPKGKLGDAIVKEFGSTEAFKEKFNEAATNRFGSGWAWLYVDKQGRLNVCSTPNQDNPLMDVAEFKGTPILALDVWEHAYYLSYHNRRPEYIQAFWNIVNWEKANENYENITGK